MRNWRIGTVDPLHRVTSLACPSVSECIAFDDAGDVLATSHPAGGPVTWTLAAKGPPGPPCDEPAHCPSPPSLWDLACPTTRFCAAVDQNGSVLATNDPTGPAASWRPVVFPGPTPGAARNDTRLACSGKSFCAAFSGGQLAASARPSTPGSWPVTRLPQAGSTAGSCPAPKLCVLPDASGGVIIVHHPLARHPRVLTIPLDPAAAALPTPASGVPLNITCPQSSLCLAFGPLGHVFAARDLAGGRGAWRRAQLDRYATPSTTVTCRTPRTCLVVDDHGNLAIANLRK